MRRKSSILLFALFAILSPAQTADETRELVRAAIRPYSGGPEDSLLDYKYRLRNTSMTLDKNLQPQDGSTTEVFEVAPVNSIPHERLLEVDGKQPSEKQLKEATKRDEKRRKRKEKRMHEEFRFGRDFLLANDFAAPRTGRLNGYEVKVITYTPKKKFPKGVDAGEFKNIAGTLWILSAPNQPPQLVKQEMHLIGPRRFVGGIVASASEAQFEMEYVEPPDKAAPGQQPIPWLPKRLSLYINMRVFGMRLRPKIIREYSEFVRVVPLKSRGRLLTPGK